MKKSFLYIICGFIVWRLLLFGFVYLGIQFLPLQNNFLGGGLGNYLKNPYFWSFINFDGEHYLDLAMSGYKPLTYFFFPVYPMIIQALAQIMGKGFYSYALYGQLVANAAFIGALIGIWKLLSLDYKKNIVLTVMALLLTFPTAFFFVGYYTESLFLVLVVWCLYFARTKKWFLASLMCAIATATRVIGLALVLAVMYEMYSQNKTRKKIMFSPSYLWLLICPLGLIAYMYFLWQKTGDPLEFFHSIGIYGQQRSAGFILPPQVIYRYVFKILPNLHYNYFPVVFTTYLEFVTGIGFLILSIVSYFKLRTSYALYLTVGYLLPTFSGSFSSFPRYAVVLFPGFIVLATWMQKLSKTGQIVVYILLLLSLGVSVALFSRAYWVA